MELMVMRKIASCFNRRQCYHCGILLAHVYMAAENDRPEDYLVTTKHQKSVLP